jgi:hypothetical protein
MSARRVARRVAAALGLVAALGAVALVVAVAAGGVDLDRSTLLALGGALVAVGVAAVVVRAVASGGRAPIDGVTPDPGAEALELDDRFHIDLTELDLTRGPVLRVELRPDPLMRRRLAERTDALELVADGDVLDVPGWLVEDRSRLVERTDRVVIPWSAIDRFRVRADRDGPDFYDVTAVSGAAGPGRWRIRRPEIADELGLLDHVRRVGRVTIELEDSIRSR